MESDRSDGLTAIPPLKTILLPGLSHSLLCMHCVACAYACVCFSACLCHSCFGFRQAFLHLGRMTPPSDRQRTFYFFFTPTTLYMPCMGRLDCLLLAWVVAWWRMEDWFGTLSLTPPPLSLLFLLPTTAFLLSFCLLFSLSLSLLYFSCLPSLSAFSLLLSPFLLPAFPCASCMPCHKTSLLNFLLTCKHAFFHSISHTFSSFCIFLLLCLAFFLHTFVLHATTNFLHFLHFLCTHLRGEMETPAILRQAAF